MQQYPSQLQDSISYLGNSLSFLNNSIRPLKRSTQDVDNLTKTLKTRRVFDVIPESIVLDRSKQLKQLVEPKIKHDIQELDLLKELYAKKKASLRKQHETLKLKLENAKDTYNLMPATARSSFDHSSSNDRTARLNLLRSQKSRLNAKLKTLRLRQVHRLGQTPN
ncbi:unnamed protein product [Ambrosiozyma monospora]|uniref:Unnamed protein product n=1 Tax=Ambrosiozyma monospora TaxID=43982 RepID=A0ACB5TAC5_AMBMO|nr:unnamed protein product [Ambrosiozyma monospora]